MNRRNFMKIVGGVLAGVMFVPKVQACMPMPSEQDNICADLQEYSDYSTQSAPFIRYRGFWFFADANIIKYCPEDKLRWDNWDTIHINYNPDAFDFWSKIEDNLYWVGEHERWEILVNPDDNVTPVRICLSGCWDGENWEIK